VKYSGAGSSGGGGGGGYVEPQSSLNRWQCPRCTFLNPWERHECEMCDTTKPHGAPPIAPGSRMDTERKQEREPSVEREAEQPREHRHKDRTAKKEKKKKHRNREEGGAAPPGGAQAELFAEPTDPFAVPPTDPFSDQFDVLAGGSASAQYQTQVTRGKAESVDFLSGGFGIFSTTHKYTKEAEEEEEREKSGVWKVQRELLLQVE